MAIKEFIVRSNVGIGSTISVRAGDRLRIAGGNINVASTGSGIVFPDGTFQTTGSSAAGGTGAVQYANGTAFAGDNTKLYFDSANTRLGVGTGSVAAGNSVAIYGGNVYVDGSITTGGSGSADITGVNSLSAVTISASTGFLGGAVSGTVFNARTSLIAPTITANTAVEGGSVNGTVFNARTSLIAPTITANTSVEGGSVSGTVFNARTSLIAATITSNGTVTGTTFVPTGSTAPTNGMFLPTTNTLGFSTSSTERVRILSTGNVGIGTTTTSTNTQLAVFGGNLQIGTASRGIVFPDGTFMNTASVSGGTAAGTTGAVQYKAADGSFGGDTSKLYFDITNSRLGIGTASTPGQTLYVLGAAPALFNTTSSGDPTIIVGTTTSVGAALGYDIAGTYAYLKASPAGTEMLTIGTTGVGINGVTSVNALDISGAAVIGGGAAYAGSATAPTNGLLVQGSVGIGTISVSPASTKVSVYGGNVAIPGSTYGIVFQDGSFMNSALGTANYSSSVFVYTGDGTTTAYSTSPLTATNVNNTMVYVNGVYQRKSTYSWSSTTLTFNVAPANAATIEINVISASTVTYGSTNFQTPGNLMVMGDQPSFFADNVGIGTSSTLGINTQLVVWGNVNIVGPSSTLLVNGNAFTSGTSISVTNDTTTNANTYYPSLTNNVTSGTLSALTTSSTKLFYNPSTGALNSTVFNGNSEGGYVSGTVFNARTSLIAATVTSNGAISGTTVGGTVITASTGFQGGYVSGTVFNASGAATVSSLTSNGAISGTTVTGSTGFLGGAVSGTVFNARTSLIAATVTSNGAISGTTVSGSTGFEGGAVSGTVFNARTSLIAATVTSNGAISGTTVGGTVITASTGFQGGYVSGTVFNASGAATVSSLTSNGAVSGTTVTGSTGFEGGAVSGTVFNARTSLIAATVTSNGAVTGTTFIPTGSTAPTNGMFLPAANTLGFATNSGEDMRIGSDGNVAIGTTATTGARFTVTSASTSSVYPEFRASNASGAETLMAANLTVGSYNPLVLANDHAYLYHNGSADTGALVIGQWSNSARGMRLDQFGNVSIGTSTVSWANANRTVLTLNGTSQSLISLNAAGATKGYLYTTGADIELAGTAGFLALTSSSSYIVFNTSATERMRILSGGSVGIGSSAPNATLDVNGTVDFSRASFRNQTLTDGATINWDTSIGQIATVTLGAAGRTMAAPTGLKVGTYILHVLQDGTGGRTITTWNAVFKWVGGVAPTLTTTANARDVFSFVSDGTNLYGSMLPDVK